MGPRTSQISKIEENLVKGIAGCGLIELESGGGFKRLCALGIFPLVDQEYDPPIPQAPIRGIIQQGKRSDPPSNALRFNLGRCRSGLRMSHPHPEESANQDRSQECPSVPNPYP